MATLVTEASYGPLRDISHSQFMCTAADNVSLFESFIYFLNYFCLFLFYK